jgi:hypothetical protein
MLRSCDVKCSPFVAGSTEKHETGLSAQARFLTGLGIGAVFGLLLTRGVRRRTETFSVQERRTSQEQVPLGIDSPANQIIDALKEHFNEVERRLASAMANLSAQLLSLQESEERQVRLFNENQRSVTAVLRHLRMLVTWTIILSCFGVVAFAIVLFLAYIKF